MKINTTLNKLYQQTTTTKIQTKILNINMEGKQEQEQSKSIDINDISTQYIMSLR